MNGYLFSQSTQLSLLSNVRIAYAQVGVQFAGSAAQSATLYDGQFIDCHYALEVGNQAFSLRNVLFANTQTGFFQTLPNTLDLQNVTFANVNTIFNYSGSRRTFNLLNCILANVTNITSSGFPAAQNVSFNGFYNSPVIGANPFTATSYPFQTVGAGSYYLTNGCGFQSVGTMNLDPRLLADLQQKTTFPPIVYSNVIVATATTLSSQVPRNTGAPDLGYHYDPLDYVFSGVEAQSNITFTAGTAVGWFDNQSGAGYGIEIDRGATVAFNGIVTAPCWFVRYDTVQEGNGNWDTTGYLAGLTSNSGQWYYSSDASQILATFTKFSSRNYNDSASATIMVTWLSGPMTANSGRLPAVAMMCRSIIRTASFSGAPGMENSNPDVNYTLRNCTVIGGNGSSLTVIHDSGSTWPVYITDCAFDGTTINIDNPPGVTMYCDHNAFLANANRSVIGGPDDVTNLTSFNWQTNWLGNYYVPANSLLADHGSVTADQIGLYHFTTQTNQTAEGTSQVNIGYHYVALDAYGNPLDSNGDGITGLSGRRQRQWLGGRGRNSMEWRHIWIESIDHPSPKRKQFTLINFLLYEKTPCANIVIRKCSGYRLCDLINSWDRYNNCR